jgi:preprotein translocase subunit SecY
MSSELGRRIGFTVGALLVFRLGTFIPVPGIDAQALAVLFRPQAGGGAWGLANLLAGGAVQRMAIFALALTPYLTAAIILQLVSIGVAPLRELPRQGERGRRRLQNWTNGLTIVLAALQASGVALALEGIPNLVNDPGILFRLTAITTLIGGTMFLVWLSSQITARGLGNGIALILLVGIVLELPAAIAGTFEFAHRGLFTTSFLLALAVFVVALTAVVVATERAQRRLTVTFTRRQVGTGMIEGRADLVLKLNNAGVMPAVIAPWLMLLPLWLSSFGGDGAPAWWRALAYQLEPGRPLQLVLFGLAILLCAYFYSAFVIDPDEVADDLKTRGGVIEGVEPGEATAAYVDYALSRTTTFGAGYLALVCLVPEILIARTGVPFYFGGTSLLLVACAMVDLEAQVTEIARIKGSG